MKTWNHLFRNGSFGGSLMKNAFELIETMNNECLYSSVRDICMSSSETKAEIFPIH